MPGYWLSGSADGATQWTEKRQGRLIWSSEHCQRTLPSPQCSNFVGSDVLRSADWAKKPTAAPGDKKVDLSFCVDGLTRKLYAVLDDQHAHARRRCEPH